MFNYMAFIKVIIICTVPLFAIMLLIFQLAFFIAIPYVLFFNFPSALLHRMQCSFYTKCALSVF